MLCGGFISFKSKFFTFLFLAHSILISALFMWSKSIYLYDREVFLFELEKEWSEPATNEVDFIFLV